jgi:hypothetical protein
MTQTNFLLCSDLCFKKGDLILLRKKIDTNWYHGESGGNHGVFPLTYVQVCYERNYISIVSLGSFHGDVNVDDLLACCAM